MADNALNMLHINVNCSNLERAIAFYELIGFRLSLMPDGTPVGEGGGNFGEVGLGPIFRLPEDCRGRFRMLRYGVEENGTVLDLIEWTSPRGAPVKRTLSQPGFARMCLTVRSCQEIYDKLIAAGHVVYTEPVLVDMGLGRFYVFCCEDPDGTIMEFMQVL